MSKAELKQTAREILAGCHKAGNCKFVANDRAQIEAICEEFLRLSTMPEPMDDDQE